MKGIPLRFVHIGMEYVICANRVVALLPARAEQAKRIYSLAKRSATYVDMTRGKPTKSFLMMEDGMLIGSPFSPRTIHRRLNEELDARVQDRTFEMRDEPWPTPQDREFFEKLKGIQKPSAQDDGYRPYLNNAREVSERLASKLKDEAEEEIEDFPEDDGTDPDDEGMDGTEEDLP